MKLDTIHECLNRRTDLVVIEQTSNRPTDEYMGPGSFVHFIEIGVAPKQPTSSITELQKILMGLIPGLTPDEKYSYCEPTLINYGSLSFDEVIGEDTITTKRVVVDPKLAFAGQFKNGVWCHEKKVKLLRRTIVTLYPHEAVIKMAREDNHYRFSISRTELESIIAG